MGAARLCSKANALLLDIFMYTFIVGRDCKMLNRISRLWGVDAIKIIVNNEKYYTILIA